MFYNILDKKRIEMLPLLKNFKEDFYLAGGTALALQIGHRDSIDFDFFTKNDFDTRKLFKHVQEVFKGRKIKKVQDEKNILTVIVEDSIKISFFTYEYLLLDTLIEEDCFRLASIRDIARMKLAAIVSRATLKDYVDLYFILQTENFKELLNGAIKKYPIIDINLILKSLVYFDDLIMEKIIFKNHKNVTLEELRNFFEKLIKKQNRPLTKSPSCE